MQVAYSLIHGEIVPAADAEYDDCAKFQITCPACREAVFKGMRAIPRNIHYFSHYRTADDASLCELRVARIAHQNGVVDGIQGHDQTLKKFLSSFRDSLVGAYEKAAGVNLWRPAMKIYTQPYLYEMAENVWREVYRWVWMSDDPRKAAESLLGGAAVLSERSPFWRRRSAAYVIDAMRHLETEQASVNRRFLVAMSFAAWPRKEMDFWDDGKTTDSVKVYMNSVAEVAKPAKVRRLLDDIRTEYQKGFEDGKDSLLEMSPVQLRAQYTDAKTRLKGSIDKINAITVGIELVVPMATLLALGCE